MDKDLNRVLKKGKKNVEEQKIISSSSSIIEVANEEGLIYLSTIQNNSIHLVLTDPPYIISKETGMNQHYNKVQQNEENDVEFVKTEEEWLQYKADHSLEDDSKKQLYLKFGTIYGKKYCVKTDYGDWDSDFTMEKLDEFIHQYYQKLRVGGTLIMFCDLWKIGILKLIMEKNKFKQIRYIEWIKTNPQPLNSSTNYLTNCREAAVVGIKVKKPTFNSKYDNGLYFAKDEAGEKDVEGVKDVEDVDGEKDTMIIKDEASEKDIMSEKDVLGEIGIYSFPLQGGKKRFHPTQKSLSLFEELIRKHSNEHDVVLDTFLGGGTTAFACKNTNRHFKGCEISTEYYTKIMSLL